MTKSRSANNPPPRSCGNKIKKKQCFGSGSVWIRFMKRIRVSKKSAKIIENVSQKYTKITGISNNFCNNIKLLLIRHKYLPPKYFFWIPLEPLCHLLLCSEEIKMTVFTPGPYVTVPMFRGESFTYRALPSTPPRSILSAMRSIQGTVCLLLFSDFQYLYWLKVELSYAKNLVYLLP